ncbi:sensor histidine kinase [Aquibacillus kalidii]|uniref:sensor histidine kinase n=1 Tax=Aquibacillus kalidii TaxID=2762597 RepID=UPI001F22E76E|nr:sensor histidine kinase [Aquibacillus kalidii]
MLERLGVIVTIAFVLTRFQFFQDLISHEKLGKKQQLIATLFFGVFGIIGTYLGVTLNTETNSFDRLVMNLTSEEAIVNSRVIGVVLAGLLGGYRMGIGAGLIAGVHRFTLGGFTGLSCGLAAILSGIIAGAFHRRSKRLNLGVAFSVGALAESVQMILILVVAKPFGNAVNLVENIGIPMIVANGVGSALFLLIINNVVKEKEKTSALQARETLRIADQTIHYLRKGITNASALSVCKILYKEMHASAVAITNKTNILAHVGLADDHHRAGSPLQTDSTREVMERGEMIVADGKSIHCVQKDCPLGAAVIAPLKQRGKTIGSLKFYFKSEKEISSVNLEMITGLSVLLSNQLEVAEADRAYQLAKEAEIKALQAQISPHFLFNSLNTIVSLIRIDPVKARKLLLSLSQFLRQNLSGTTTNMTSLQQELNHTKAYLTIEEARFVDKLTVLYDIDESVMTTQVPPLTLQPLVENAVKHGIRNMERDCIIHISIKMLGTSVEVKVEDNGDGIESKRLIDLGQKPLQSKTGSGLGLYNVNRRLRLTFGENAVLRIDSQPQKGTQITFLVPNGGKTND